MLYNKLIGTDLNVSEVGFGLWTLSTSGWSSRSRSENSVNLLRSAFDLGVNFYDTADSYGRGYSEELLFESLGSVRNEIVISTKFGFDFYPPDLGMLKSPHLQKPEKNFDPDYIAFACEQSLRRLNTDYIDLITLHYPDLLDVEKDHVFEQLERLVEDGKILYWGAALDNSEDSSELVEILVKDREISVLHVPGNVFERNSIDIAIECCQDDELAMISRRPHYYGLLESDDTKGIELLLSEDSNNDSNNLPEGVVGNLSQCIEFIRACSKFGVAPQHAAMRYVLDIPAVSVTVPNIRNMDTLIDFCVDFGTDEIPSELNDVIVNL